MKRLILGLAVGAALATIALVFTIVLAPSRRPLWLDIYVLVVGGMAVFTGVLLVRRAYPQADTSAIAAALEEQPQATLRPPDLDRTDPHDAVTRLDLPTDELVRLGDRNGLSHGCQASTGPQPGRRPPSRRHRTPRL